MDATFKLKLEVEIDTHMIVFVPIMFRFQNYKSFLLFALILFFVRLFKALVPGGINLTGGLRPGLTGRRGPACA